MTDYLNIHAENIILVVVLFLAAFSTMVFIWAIFSRWMLNLKEQKAGKIREKLSDWIIQYISGDLKFEVLRSKLNSKIAYSILMQLSQELEKTLDGQEQDRLKRLLNLTPIRSYYQENFESGDELEKAKACLYFSRQSNVKSSILKKMTTHTSSAYPMLAYASGLAVVTHGKAEQAEQAIHNLLSNNGVSDQALNDIFKKFYSHVSDNFENQNRFLIQLISSDRYSKSRTALMVRVMGELHMYQSAGELLSLFRALNPDAYSPELASAYIDVLAEFGMSEILEQLHEIYSGSEYREVRESVARALGVFRDPISKPILKWLLMDPDFYVRFFAAHSLVQYEDVDLNELNLPAIEIDEYRELIGEVESIIQTGV